MNHSVIILAAGRGLRMRSERPKLLHSIGGVSILQRILSTVSFLNPSKIGVVIGYQGEALKNSIESSPDIVWVEQTQQLGTGHASLQALPAIGEVDRVLVLYGDIPLITTETLQRLLTSTGKNEIGFITVQAPDPTGLGRVLRNKKGEVIRIVEEKDATISEKQLKEINAGFFLVPKVYLQKWLPELSAGNSQKEYYLTDIMEHAVEEGVVIRTISPQFEWEVLGVNDKIQLAGLERCYQATQARQLMEQGVTLRDPARLDVRGDITVGKDVTIDVNVILEGTVVLGDNLEIGPNVYIKDSVIHSGAQILANSVIVGAKIGEDCTIGPFARIRPGTELKENVRIGNFVEVKNSTIDLNSKINHLSYVGDSTIGEDVNIGAGVITCNFDGKDKHQTIIGDRVFVGSDTQLIAPVTIGNDVTIGAGTTVVHDIPSNHLLHNRVEYRTVSDWKKTERES